MSARCDLKYPPATGRGDKCVAIEQALGQLERWGVSNLVEFNALKTKLLVFSRPGVQLPHLPPERRLTTVEQERDLIALGVAVVGAGYWGPNLVRNFAAASGAEVRWVCDLSIDRAKAAVGYLSDVRVTDALEEVLGDDAVDKGKVAFHRATSFTSEAASFLYLPKSNGS